MKGKIKKLLELADMDLERSHRELYQPAEDVVEYSVCILARRALYLYLQALFLLFAEEENEPITDEEPTLEYLINYCGKHDDRIKSLDISLVYCKGKGIITGDEDNFFFCNDVFKVKYCSELAESVRGLVFEKVEQLA